jgi:prevent-host-death family protein
MDVGIRELKARLSHFVRMASSGERVVVTERGRAVAHLTAVPTEVPASLPAALAALVEQGRVTAPTRVGQWAPVPRAHATRSAASILDEDRGET